MELWQVIFLVVYFVCFGLAAYSGIAHSNLKEEIEKCTKSTIIRKSKSKFSKSRVQPGL